MKGWSGVRVIFELQYLFLALISYIGYGKSPGQTWLSFRGWFCSREYSHVYLRYINDNSLYTVGIYTLFKYFRVFKLFMEHRIRHYFVQNYSNIPIWNAQLYFTFCIILKSLKYVSHWLPFFTSWENKHMHCAIFDNDFAASIILKLSIV